MKEIDPSFRTDNPNSYHVGPDGCPVIHLYDGTRTIVSPEDLAKTLRIRWSCGRSGLSRNYVNGHAYDTEGGARTISLHRYLLDFPAALDVDHIDGDPRNNRRENLRTVSHAENAGNRHGLQRGNTTGHWCIKEANRRRDGTFCGYSVVCNNGRAATGHACACHYFPHTPDGLAAAIAFRDEHWRSHHPGLRTDQLALDQATEAAAKEAA